MDRETIEALLDNSIKMLYEKEAKLFEGKYEIHERTLAHKLAIYIDHHLKKDHLDYDVDLEYNRMNEIKDGVYTDKILPKYILFDSETKKGKIVVPDIIIHKRRSPKNILALEIKPSWAEDLEPYVRKGVPMKGKKFEDQQKLNYYLSELKYCFSYYIELGYNFEEKKVLPAPFDLN